MAKRQQDVAARYTGDGRVFIIGVPARDLTLAEWTALTDKQRSAATESALYDVAQPPKESEKEKAVLL